jgi:periplasmic protein TonB
MSNQQIFLLADSGMAKPKVSVLLPPTGSVTKQDVLAEAILDQASTSQKRNPLKFLASMGAHVAVLMILLLMPLYFSQGLDFKRLQMTLLVAPLPPMAAPPPPPAAAVTHIAAVTPKTFTPGKLTAPSFVPKVVAAVSNDVAPPEMMLTGVSGGVPGGMAGGQVGGVLGGMMAGVPAPALAASEGPKKPVRVGGDVKAPRLLSGTAPIYPILAKQSRIQGVVVIEAIIDERGNVVEEHAVSGHPLLVAAALTSVKQRKYEPTILDGEPTPVSLRVEVNFHLG